VTQSAIISHEILSTALFSTSQTSKCTAVTLQVVELSHSHTTWLLVNTTSKVPLLNHHNRIKNNSFYTCS